MPTPLTKTDKPGDRGRFHYSLPTYYLLLLTYCSLLATRTPDCDICAMPIPTQVDWANLQRHDPDRIFDLAGTKRKYGVVEHAT